ncbi:MAG: phenylalanine--tRNA ligase subunit beta [Candidatus Colwellbacteria bacterium]|nr:phenylalanine--tRNA ligase subunit beta [Candidatus Colwellbacteria bacterium]
MKFSHKLLSTFIPALPSARLVAETLALRLFEVEAVNGDTLDVKVLPNRWADAASHRGLALELAVILGLEAKLPPLVLSRYPRGIPVTIESADDCARYGALTAELGATGKSPRWLANALTACGLRPIHPVVDITNYVMLETGQPLHAFDADAIAGGIVVRRAARGEPFMTIDGRALRLVEDDLVIADQKRALGLAGVKGGKNSEVSAKTRRIVLEAANFNAATILETSRRHNLTTDASQRFSHGLSPESVSHGLARAAQLLEEICGARIVALTDMYPTKQGKTVVAFDIGRFNALTGLSLDWEEAKATLERLGCSIRRGALVEVPPLRLDLEIFEDLVEEVVRVRGLETVPATPPRIELRAPADDPIIVFNDTMRRALTHLGASEVYTSTFVGAKGEGVVAVENPIAEDRALLRSSLISNLSRALDVNGRRLGEARLFEIGKIFKGERAEAWSLGIGVFSRSRDPVRELKGIVETLLRGVGIPSPRFVHRDGDVVLLSGEKELGVVKSGHYRALGELDLGAAMKNAREEQEYRIPSAYPAVTRDLSCAFPPAARVGEAIAAIETLGIPDLIDVDLVDYYTGEEVGAGKMSATFRLTFQSWKRTLTSEEVDVGVRRIIAELTRKFGAETRE